MFTQRKVVRFGILAFAFVLAFAAYIFWPNPAPARTCLSYSKEFVGSTISLTDESGKTIIPDTTLPTLTERDLFGQIEKPGLKSFKKKLKLRVTQGDKSITFSFWGENSGPRLLDDKEYLSLRLTMLSLENKKIAQLQMTGNKYKEHFYYAPGEEEEGENMRAALDRRLNNAFLPAPTVKPPVWMKLSTNNHNFVSIQHKDTKHLISTTKTVDVAFSLADWDIPIMVELRSGKWVFLRLPAERDGTTVRLQINSHGRIVARSKYWVRKPVPVSKEKITIPPSGPR
jgi:hypothetical protein